MTDRLPTRAEVRPDDTWDLSRLFAADADWERAFADYEALIPGYAAFRGTLGDGPAALAACLDHDTRADRLGDRVWTYASLKASEDVSNGTYQGMRARALNAAGRAAEAGSYIRPEVLALPDATIAGYLAAPELAGYKLVLERLVRLKPHTLSANEERLLAMGIEAGQTARQVFEQLHNADLQFGTLEVEPGRTIDLTHGSFYSCLENPDRGVRERAFRQYYGVFAGHAHTLAAALGGSVKQDVYQARVRNHPTARAAALFPDQVPGAVYDNLVAAVRAKLPAVHKYYALRQRVMGLPDLHAYDVYVPLVPGVRKRTGWDEAVGLVIDALAPLGTEYTAALAGGLRGRWCDRYENKGKRSGAFSSGCYDSDPYILMNYQPDIFDHVFTLAHEAGHSMHTLHSKGQPYQYSQYTIFVAEVASTFNEQLLNRHLLDRATTDRERAYYVNREADEIRKTLVRQTMFAEFEAAIHARAEANQPLTLDFFRDQYRALLAAYFGPDFTIDDELGLEGLRVPHFYNAFYVYKYATGLSAAVALAGRVLGGGKAELDAYLGFLRGGSSRDPLDLLRAAGVDMASPGPVAATLDRFEALVDELDGLSARSALG